MRRRIALVCACLLACSSEEVRDARETYDYLVTPTHRRFRLIGAGAVLRGANTRLGLRIRYVSDALTKAELIANADALVGALGPELQLPGDKTLTVRARLGGASVGLDSEKASYDLEYRLGPTGFQRTDQGKPSPALAGTGVGDDPKFPFQPSQLTAAAAESRTWLALIDDSDPDLDAIREHVTPAFWAQLTNDAQLEQLLAQRTNAGLPGKRRELYRMQQRITDRPRAPGDDALIAYECDSPGRPHILERLFLARDADRWRIASYAFQPLPP